MSVSGECDLEKGKKAFDDENYLDAFKYLLPCAEADNAEAQAIVGFLYYIGKDVERELSKAIHYLTLAAEKGRGEAAHNLGTLYLTCEPDLPKNTELSKKWYLKAKELGFVVAPDEWYENL